MKSYQDIFLNGIKVLTTDPEKRIGLYSVRYLGQAGARITSVWKKNAMDYPISFNSRYLESRVIFDKNTYENKFKEFLFQRSKEFHFINPIDVSNMLLVHEVSNKTEINQKYLLPDRESLLVADNKELLTKHATRIGLCCPKSYYMINPDEIFYLSNNEFNYPCIIKFRGAERATHWSPEERYSIVHTPEAMQSEYKRMHAIEEFPVIQEYIHGRGYGYFALFDRSHLLKAQFCHKRIREYPISGGPSSCCESFYDDQLIHIGRTLLESLSWKGLGMVEFKFDEIRKKWYIIEVNPRYWGSLPLAVISGVNFPVLHALSALGVKYKPINRYKTGVKVRFIQKDVRSIASLIKAQNCLRTRISLICELFNPLIKDGVVNTKDLGPVFKSVQNSLKKLEKN